MEYSQTAEIRIGAKQADRQFKLAYLECIINAVGAALLLTAVWILDLSTVAAVLCGAPLLITIVRWMLAISYNRASPPSAEISRWQLLFNIGALANALSWGAAATYLVYVDNLVAAALAIGVAVIMSLGTVVLYAGAPTTTIAFATLALAPAAAIAATRFDTVGAFICAALFAALTTAIICARVAKGLVWDAVITGTENEQLIGHLDQRRTQVEKLNIALKTNTDKREQAEITLRRTSADLGLVEGKAKALAHTLERVSPICQVTGLSNRRHFDQQFESEWRRATREKKSMSLVIVGVDEFTEYFDTYGSQSSDALLKKIGQTIRGYGRRSGDLAGRYEDDKLALMLPGCEARNAMRMAEALRKRIEGIKVAHGGAKNRETVTIHVGVATIKPALSLPNAELQKRTDAALYEARFQGGNKVVAYQPLSKLKLERWNKPNDGPLSEQAMLQKLLVWGYDTAKGLIRPDDKPQKHVSEHDTIVAALSGELLVDVEGHTMVIKAGDSIFVPHGVTIMLQAKNEKPVITFTATRSD